MYNWIKLPTKSGEKYACRIDYIKYMKDDGSSTLIYFKDERIPIITTYSIETVLEIIKRR